MTFLLHVNPIFNHLRGSPSLRFFRPEEKCTLFSFQADELFDKTYMKTSVPSKMLFYTHEETML